MFFLFQIMFSILGLASMASAAEPLAQRDMMTRANSAGIKAGQDAAHQMLLGAKGGVHGRGWPDFSYLSPIADLFKREDDPRGFDFGAIMNSVGPLMGLLK